MWHKGSGERVTDQGVQGPQGKCWDGATMKGGESKIQIRGER